MLVSAGPAASARVTPTLKEANGYPPLSCYFLLAGLFFLKLVLAATLATTFLAATFL